MLARSGCVDLNDYLSTIKKRDNLFCDYFDNNRETVEHCALYCLKYNVIHLTLFNELNYNVLNVTHDTIDLHTPLDGGDGLYKSRLKILNFI